jgi:hypothetical protein
MRLEHERTAQGRNDELPAVSLQVLQALRTQERLTVAQLAFITNANRNTLKVRLRELVSAGRVRQHGKARATCWSQVYTPVKFTSGKSYPYGFGWFIEESGGKPWYRHPGTWQVFETYIRGFSYLAVFGNRSLRVELTLAPDNRISSFNLSSGS